MKKLAVVGAGAKAAAIVARAAAYRGVTKTGQPPNITVFERDHVASAWSGKGAYSSGFLELCTPGEKDVGFPYADIAPRGVRRSLAQELHARFSWQAFLVSGADFSNWVDRGRQHPTHRRFADYLEWVFEVAAQTVTPGVVTHVAPAGGGGWTIHSIQNGSPESELVDGVVLTGTGAARAIPVRSATGRSIPRGRVLTAENFWSERDVVAGLSKGTIAVVGDGGAAGTIVAWLAEVFEELPVSVLSINPLGTLFLRGDGFAERRWFSNPSEWPKLSEDDRRRILARTDTGVVSQRIKAVIDQAGNVEYVTGRVESAVWTGSELHLDVQYGATRQTITADYLVVAVGFDGWSLLDLVQHPRVAVIRGDASLRQAIEGSMRSDLSLPDMAGLGAGIHLPGLAALRHGPGLGSLNSLGLMASSVLDPYITP